MEVSRRTRILHAHPNHMDISVISIAVGLAAGCIPVVDYNIGAGRRDRAKALFLRLLTAGRC